MSLAVAFAHRLGTQSFDVRFDAPTPGVTVLFGPSGSGKSTIASVLAGVLRPARCRLALDGTVLADTDAGVFVPPEQRRIGTVFQDARLFPHLSVRGNLRYGARRAGASEALPGTGWDQVVALLALDALLSRAPATLSGGERQRVAIGRALLARPRLLVLDEPLASLDASRRDEILPYLARLRDLGVPILYVTHAMDEVLRLADTLVLLHDGRVQAAGPLPELAARPDLPLAGRDDAGTVLQATVVADDGPYTRLQMAPGAPDLLVPRGQLRPGQSLRLRIPASEVSLAAGPLPAVSITNQLPVMLHRLTPQPDGSVLASLALADGGPHLLARVTADAVARLHLAPGTQLIALVKAVSVRVVG